MARTKDKRYRLLITLMGTVRAEFDSPARPKVEDYLSEEALRSLFRGDVTVEQLDGEISEVELARSRKQ